MTELLEVSVEDGVATIRLNRPEAGNAIDIPLARALVDAATRCDQDAAIRCVVLSGNGRLFCAGGDIATMQQAGEQRGEVLSVLAGTVHMAAMRLARMNKPLLCAVNGPAAGAGMSLAIMGDVVLARRAAHFTTAYGAIGLTPDGGMSWMLPRLVGLRRAQDLIVNNRRVGADEAETIGLITRAVDDDRFDEEVRSAAGRLAQAATAAIGAARALLLGSYGNGYETQLELETRSIAAAAAGPEGREGVAAFLEKRKPRFQTQVPEQ